MTKKAPPRPQALHLEDPGGGAMQIGQLYARLDTYRKFGEEAMSPHDLRNGYSPQGLIRMMTRQLLVMLRRKDDSMADGEQWLDRLGTPRQSYLLRDEIANLERQLKNMEDTTMESRTEPKTPPHEKNPEEQGGGGALARLSKASEIRRAIFLVRAQLKEIRKIAKDKITVLDGALAKLLDDLDAKQMTLFDCSADLPEKVQAILDDPSL